MDIPNTFKDIAPFLQHPLVLIGFVILLFFGILTTLFKAGILPPLPRKTAGDIVKRVINFGFIIALLIILLGFWEHFNNHDKDDSTSRGGGTRDSTHQNTHDSLVTAGNSGNGDHSSLPKVYCTVTLLIPSEYNDAEIRVDGRPAVIVERKPTSVTIRMVKSETSQTIVLRSSGGGKCSTSVLVDGDKQLNPCL